MYPSIATLKKVLVAGSYISDADSSAAESAANGDATAYVEYLMSQELLSKTLLGQALAESYHLPYADLGSMPSTKETVQQIAEDFARQHRVVFVKASSQVVAVATDAPDGVDAKGLQAIFKSKKVRLAYTLPEYVDASFALYAQSLDTRFSEIITSGQRVAPEIVDEIVKDALTYHASDIHFEPQHDGVIVRFRVDGGLREAGKIPSNYYENILNRIKIESGMRIDEHLTAQDGAIQRQYDTAVVNLRISLVPTIYGEKVVMRVLSSYVQNYSLADIGLSEAQRTVLETNAGKPFGMILTTGPTGSGKTTTLYSLIKLLARPDINITTIEDPVEYKFEGINQIQVQEQANMTFERGLRAIVRQDPDVILVGEIRDRETAEISVNAALTGHLLLSTFHANDAATAIPRLIDMGIEPFLLASTLEVVVAQRLVRKLCTQCRYSLPAHEVVAQLPQVAPQLAHYFGKDDNLYASKGCANCNQTGFTGRTALYEFIEITPAVQELIIRRPSTQEVETLARSEGSLTMFDDGLAKAKAGQTTLTEVLRVVQAPKVTKEVAVKHGQSV